MNAIVSVTRDWGIGIKNNLLVSNPADMRHFVELTCAGHKPQDALEGEIFGTVVMGRKTLESFPGGKPLRARRNIVMSHASNYAPEGVVVVHDKSELSEALAGDTTANVWLIGGASVYNYLLDNCERAYVTMHDCIREADSYFPNLDVLASWELEDEQPGGTTDEGIDFTFRIYKHL